MLLAIGFGVGYWLLVTANKHEGNLKTVGEYLGVAIIALVILTTVLGFFYSIKVSDSDYLPNVRQQKFQILDKNKPEDIQKNEDNPMLNNETNEDNENDNTNKNTGKE